jgi:CBS domain-containing protein
MKRSEPVASIMVREPAVVHEKQRLSEVRRAFTTLGIHHMPVVSGRRFLGMLSAADLLRVSWGDPNRQDERMTDALLDTQTIRDVMVEDVVTLPHDATIRDAARKLATGSYHALPVLDGEELVGLVTSTDLIRCLLEQF